MKLCWLTDIHLDHHAEQTRAKFYRQLNTAYSDAIIITGDLATAKTLQPLLIELASRVTQPIYFVLGNHDYYHGEVNQVRQQVTTLVDQLPNLHWLQTAQPIQLTANTRLIGVDSWADGRCGSYATSRVVLNDSRLIIDLLHASLLGRQQLLEAMQQLADHDAEILNNLLLTAIRQQPQKIIIATHQPPFAEACWHNDNPGDDEWLPFFTCEKIGENLLSAATANPQIEFIVLSGHTHTKHVYSPLANLTVKVGQATYEHPEIQALLTVQ